MNDLQRNRWVEEVLIEVMKALIHDPKLCEILVFKGAWILNFHLQESRHSRDIDAAAEPGWVRAMGGMEGEEAFLREHLPRAVKRYFERQNPVRFTLSEAKIKRNPKSTHPHGWDMIQVSLLIQDNQKQGVRGLPAAELEIAAPESYSADAIETRDFLGMPAHVYSLHRIAGEKLRAYLTSLPEYRLKMGAAREFRVKDLHDIARIVRHRPIEHIDFWMKAGHEFRLACESRYVDCLGPETFKQDWEAVRVRYEQDEHLRVVSFVEVESALDQVLEFLRHRGAFPLAYPLPILL